jgi:hypothetical protein
MEEARLVLARLERIETLNGGGAPAGELLREVRALLGEAEAWARAERGVPDTALDAVEQCRLMLRDGRQMLGSTSRTLLA